MKITRRFWVLWEPKTKRTSLGWAKNESTMPRREEQSVTKWTVFGQREGGATVRSALSVSGSCYKHS